MIRVIHFQRKPLPIHKSVEFIFEDVRQRLPNHIHAVKLEFSKFSKGLLPRLLMLWEAYKFQGEINHVTGDVHFVTLLLPKKRTILTVLDCVALKESTGFKKFIFTWLWFKLPLKKTQYLTAISESTKQEIIRYTGFPSNKIFVIPVAVSSLFTFHPKNFNQVKPVLLQVGTTPNKNILRLIEAIHGLSCELWIIGNLELSVKDLLEKYQIDYRNFTQLKLEEVVSCYVQSDILCFVSTYEGFGMPIIEANAVGRVVLSSNVASMPEVAGDAALLVNPFDITAIRTGIETLIENREVREDYIQKGLTNAKRFDANHIAMQYAALYDTIVDELKN